ncbi:receptor-like protein 12 [Chenopodium quinoa]|uniref:receptor-like protein 12 n=1 Tax=Chenopodium quinoa TaxID=63459 RepID=UPI000B77E8E4|nr:receptor-like protein 12 [Chenopodium quinoa]
MFMCYLSCIYILFLVPVCSHAIKLNNFVSSSRPSCADHERLALQQFRQSFLINCAVSDSASAYPKVKSWSGELTRDCCMWDGVECEEETGHVTGLDLSSSCLYGNFPPNSTLFSLIHLKKLNLAFNDFNYSLIPSKLGQINKIQNLNLSYSSFSGQIPSEISKLSQLYTLDLSNNGDSLANSQLNLKLQGRGLEKLLRNLTRIQKLYLDMVVLSTKVPIILTNLTSLKAISLQYCNLYGELPTSVFKLPQLEFLYLSGNRVLAGFLPQFQSTNPLKELYLFGTAFSGEVPPSIGNLAHLEQLDLCGCYFSGSLPSSLANMTTLTVLLLSRNNFKGEVPFSITNLTSLEALDFSNLEFRPQDLFSQLSKLHNLSYLRLAEMKLATEIPPFIANFTKLNYLDLASSQLIGPFPQWFANLTKLRQLYLENNQLDGPIPQWFSQFTNLQSIDLSYNNLFGKFEIFFHLKNLRNLALSQLNLTFPSSTTNSSLPKLKLLELEFCNLTDFPQFLQYQNELQSLSLKGNKIKGNLPQWLVNTTKENLLKIDLSQNNLTGFEKPAAELPWTHLEDFCFRGNKLQGLVPSPPGSMKFYDISDNLLTGVIPRQICNAKSLISLDLSGNNMTGQIPDCVGQLGESLQLLNLRGNNLRGTSSIKFSKYCKLKMINLSQNQLGGELPRSLANCKMLEVLDVGRNQINDSFPSWLGSLPKLQVLVLSHNKFFGGIMHPKPYLGFRFLRIIDLSHNLHTGHLPSRYFQNWHAMRDSKEEQSGSYNTLITFYFKVGTDLVISEQNFEYSITITNKGNEILYPKVLKVFRVIDLSSNSFTGRIPDVVGDLKGLQALNLSNNNLEALSQLTSLEVFNISNNDHLMGPVPQGNQFNTFDDTSFQGNPGLCGSLLSKKCVNEDVPPPTVNIDESNDDSELIDWVVRSLGCISGTIVGFVIGKIYITDKYHEWFMDTFGRRRPTRRVRRA